MNILQRSWRQIGRPVCRKFAEVAETAAKQEANKSGSSFQTISTLTILGLVGGFFYRSKKSLEKQRGVEDNIHDNLPIFPAEIADMRRTNKLTIDELEKIWASAREAFPKGVATAKDFDAFLMWKLPSFRPEGVQNAHLLERVVLSMSEQHKGEPISLSALFVGLTMMSAESIDDRLALIFRFYDADESGSVSFDTFADVVKDVVTTCQLPVSFRVTQTQKWPFRDYREKTPREMAQYALKLKEKSEDERIEFKEFVEMLTSKAVCIWGECYGKDVPVPR